MSQPPHPEGPDTGLASRFDPPYTAVIFSSIRTEGDRGYARASEQMEASAQAQPGYLGMESARDPQTRLGITVSYWRDAESARAWKAVTEHERVQRAGRQTWYADYVVRVATVERDYAM